MTKEEMLTAASDYFKSPLAYEGFINGVAWAYEHLKPSWIDVNDKLPCEFPELMVTFGSITFIPVIIATENKVTTGLRMKDRDNKWFWCENVTVLSTITEKVLYWMPIPKFPKNNTNQ